MMSHLSKADVNSKVDVESVRPEDSASRAGRSSVTTSSIGLRRLELSAKKAAILAEASLAKHQHDLEVKQTQRNQEMRELDLKRRLAVLEAQDEVLANADIEQNDRDVSAFVHSQDGDSQDGDVPVNHDVSYVEPPHVSEPEVIIAPSSPTDVVSFLKQGQMQNAQLIEAIKLPSAQLAPFDGDPIKYWTFIRAFENCVASSLVDDGAKLIRLVHYCTGQARKVIDSCMVMQPAEGYARALELLKERFGNQFIILQSWIRRITAGAQIKSGDRSQLQQFADDLMCCRETLVAMNACHEVNNQATLLRIVKRPPAYLQSRWKREIVQMRVKSKSPDINDVVTFVVNAAAEANDPVYGHLNCAVHSEVMKQKHHASTAAPRGISLTTTCSGGNRADSGKLCMLCNGRHALFMCNQFIGMKLDDRLKYASDKKLCYNCLSVGHVSSKCNSSYTCQVPGCNKKHSKYLHRVKPAVNNADSANVGVESDVPMNSTESVAQCTFTVAGARTRIALPIVPVVVSSDEQDVVVSTYALLDSGSTNSFCSAQLVDQFRVTGQKSQLSLTTLDNANSVTEMQSVSLKITGMNTGASVALPVVYVRPQIYMNGLDAVRTTDLTQWSHFSGTAFPDVSLSQVSLLIGQDVPEALIPLEVSEGNAGDPYAVRTILGWCLNGSMSDMTSANACVNFLCTEQSLEEQVEKFWKLETSEQSRELALSVSDHRAVALWEQSIKLSGGHYEMAIPFKARPNFSDNKVIALKRLESLRKKLMINPKTLK